MIRGFLWSWLPYIYNKTCDTISLVTRIIKAAYKEGIIEKEWLILKNHNIPIYSLLFPDTPTGVIKWSCKTNPPIFTDPNVNVNTSRHISYLSFVVNISGYDPIDLTEWINTVQWNGLLEPTLYDLFTLWCCETGNSYFHLIPIITIELITEAGDSLSKGLNDYVISITSTNGDSRFIKNNTIGPNTIRIVDPLLSSGGC